MKILQIGHIDGRKIWANFKSLNVIHVLYCDNSLTMKDKNIF